MAATADKTAYASTTGHESFSNYRQAFPMSVLGYQTAPLVKRGQRDEDFPFPESRLSRRGYLRPAKTVLAGERIIFRGIPGLAVSEVRMDALPRPERSNLQHISTSSAPLAITISVKSFAMHKEHIDFLTEVSTGESPSISLETAHAASVAWRLIWKASGFKIPVPAAGTGPDGEMFYAWNAGRYHLELEIIPGQPAEFFYRDRETGEYWGEDYVVGEPLPARIVSKLGLFK